MRFVLSFIIVLCMATVAHTAPVTVNNCGEPLTFDKVPSRVVIHDINMADMAFALGLQDRIVGLTGISGWYKTDVVFDKRRGEIPELAPKYPSLENLVAASPDLFIAGWYYGMKPGGDVTPDTLAPLGIKTLILSESCIHKDENQQPASIDLLFDDMLRLGKVFDVEERAGILFDSWKIQLDFVKGKVFDNPIKRVFLYDSGKDKPFTIGKYAIANAMIEVAGGKSVTADLETSWGNTSWEAIAAQNPEFLVLMDYQSGEGAKGLFDFLENHPAMRETDAVKNKSYIGLRYEELTPGPANIDAIEKIARAMYPKSF